MIIEYIRYEVADPAAFIAAYDRARQVLERSEHCRAYELSRCTEDTSTFILRIEWDSVAGHLRGFRNSAEFPDFLRAVQPFMPEIREMRHYELTAIAARK